MMARTSVGSVLGLRARGVVARARGGRPGRRPRPRTRSASRRRRPRPGRGRRAGPGRPRPRRSRPASRRGRGRSGDAGRRPRRRPRRSGVADQGSLHRGHRSTTSARPAARQAEPFAGPCRRVEASGARPQPGHPGPPRGPPRPRPGPHARRPSARSAGPSQCSPTQSVDRSPARNPGSRATQAMERQRGLDPGDDRPRRAPGRGGRARPRGPPRATMTLAIRLSYSGGMRSPSTRPVSTRTPGPGRHPPAPDRAGRRGEVAGRGPRRSGGPRSRGRAGSRPARRRPGRRPTAARPAARRNCSWTRSRPVTSSVIPCSTWRRVLTSRKWKAPSGERRNSHGGGVAQPGGRRDPDGLVVQVAPLGRGQARRRRLLDELLVAALERAVPLAEGDDAAGRVAEELDLDVACRADLALEVDRAIAERRQGLGRRRPPGPRAAREPR